MLLFLVGTVTGLIIGVGVTLSIGTLLVGHLFFDWFKNK